MEHPFIPVTVDETLRKQAQALISEAKRHAHSDNDYAIFAAMVEDAVDECFPPNSGDEK